MANIKSQIKRIKTNEKSRVINKAARSEIKTRIKSAVESASNGSEDAETNLRNAIKKLDKAASKGIIHKNQAARRKSRLMKQIASL
ncbi:MAG: 30S ribosomal protein S20 [Acidimicrobiaceae bacterium]|nr:30S ribosomal protein S20 [Acidimicrobiaceae bacterium]